MRAFMVGGKPRITSASKGMKEWRELVAVAAQTQTEMWTTNPGQPVGVVLDFYMPRPKGHFGKKGLLPSAPLLPAKKPDLDKLIRAVLDALTGVLMHDDAQVCSITARKHFACESKPAGVAVSVFGDDRKARTTQSAGPRCG